MILYYLLLIIFLLLIIGLWYKMYKSLRQPYKIFKNLGLESLSFGVPIDDILQNQGRQYTRYGYNLYGRRFNFLNQKNLHYNSSES